MPEGELTGVVIKTGDDTMMGRIASLAMTTNVEQTPINKEIEHFIHIISAIAIFLGVSFFIIGATMGTEWVANLVFMIGIIVANVPEGLLTTVTVCLTLTAKRMYVKQVMVKNLEGVETLGSTSCICSDKTGTLTQNIMTVAQLVYADDGRLEDPRGGLVVLQGRQDLRRERGLVPRAREVRDAHTCNFDKRHRCKNEDGLDDPAIPTPPFNVMVDQEGSDVQMEKVLWEPIGNASEAAFIKLTQKLMESMFGCVDVDEFREQNAKIFDIPFNSKYKYQVHVHKDPERGGAPTVYMKGAPERIIGRCTELRTGETNIEMTTELWRRSTTLQARMGANGLRVLGMAEKRSSSPSTRRATRSATARTTCRRRRRPTSRSASLTRTPRTRSARGRQERRRAPTRGEGVGLSFVGLMALIDPPRPAVPGAVSLCKTAGIKVIMVTGDHPDTAKAIAHKVGISGATTPRTSRRRTRRRASSRATPTGSTPRRRRPSLCLGSTIDVSDPEAQVERDPQAPADRVRAHEPQQKLVIVGNCQRLGHIVAVTGDGVNDSPAIKKADIGVAMGIAGTPVTQNAADMILRDDNFASIVAGVEEGRLIFDNLKKSICYTLTSNIPRSRRSSATSRSARRCRSRRCSSSPSTSAPTWSPPSRWRTRRPRPTSCAARRATPVIDRLVTRKLIFLAYFQIGIMQAMAGFFAWMVILNDYGFPPHILFQVDVGKQWAKDAHVLPLLGRLLRQH